MNTWCVCQMKNSGMMFTISRTDREAMLKVLMKLKMGINSRVLKTFDNEMDAIKYMNDQNNVNRLIESL